MKFPRLPFLRLRAPDHSPGPAARDAHGITSTIRDALVSAGIDPRAGVMADVSHTIDEALRSAGLLAPNAGSTPTTSRVPAARVIESAERVVAQPVLEHRPMRSASPGAPGALDTHSFTSGAGTRMYKVYVPISGVVGAGEPLPMVVMLHGCTQSPDDFATGTRMNKLAEEHGFIVVYPAQAANANGSKCWNWFRPQDQGRDRGEPSLIAGITREVMHAHRVDPRRVFVAGLSAGGAMAVILGHAYPELYAGVGVHSGVPYRAARDMPSAFGVMRNGPAVGVAHDTMPDDAGTCVPTIVFHGDADATVDPRNGRAIIEQVTRSHTGTAGVQTAREHGVSAHGNAFTRTTYSNANRVTVAEYWQLAGAGHAWSGGGAGGSFVETSGPDASAAMVRFFLGLRPVTQA